MALFSILLFFLIACGKTEWESFQPFAAGINADHVGKIIEINTDNRRILIEEALPLQASEEPSLIWYTINEGTNIIDEKGELVPFDAFQEGDLVGAWHTGALLYSYPPQAVADKIMRMPLHR